MCFFFSISFGGEKKGAMVLRGGHLHGNVQGFYTTQKSKLSAISRGLNCFDLGCVLLAQTLPTVAHAQKQLKVERVVCCHRWRTLATLGKHTSEVLASGF